MFIPKKFLIGGGIILFLMFAAPAVIIPLVLLAGMCGIGYILFGRSWMINDDGSANVGEPPRPN